MRKVAVGSSSTAGLCLRVCGGCGTVHEITIYGSDRSNAANIWLVKPQRSCQDSVNREHAIEPQTVDITQRVLAYVSGSSAESLD